MLEDACHDAGETLSVSEPGDGGRNGLYKGCQLGRMVWMSAGYVPERAPYCYFCISNKKD